MDSLPADQQHHPFVDLDVDVHHDGPTDAEEALEAIRVAIGQSTDYDPLTDVTHDDHANAHESHGHGPTSIHEQQQQQQDQSGPDDAAPPVTHQHASTSSGVSVATVHKALSAIMLVGSANQAVLSTIDSSEHSATIRSVIEGFTQIDRLVKDLQTQLQDHPSDCKFLSCPVGRSADYCHSPAQHRSLAAIGICPKSRV